MKEIVFGLLVLGSASAAPQKKEQKPVSVFIEKLSPHPFYEELRYVSNLKPFRAVQVFSHIDGNVEQKLKSNGEYVRKGERIAAIKSITPGYSYANHIVKAPISGVITGFYEEVGAHIRKSSSLLAIADVSSWRVAIPIPQQDLKVIDEGKFRVVIQPQGQNDMVVGRLLRVSPNIDPVLGTSIVEFVFPRAKLKGARVGMIANLRVQYNMVESIGIDEKYIMESRSKKKKYVYIVKDDMTAERRYIDIGAIRDGRAQVTSGLKAGETIITQMPSWSLKKGTKVAPQNTVSGEKVP